MNKTDVAQAEGRNSARWLTSLAVVVLGWGSAAQLQAHPLEGSWQLVSGEISEHGTEIDYSAAKMQGVKIVSGLQFSFISHKDGKFYSAAAGAVVLQGQNYQETPHYASYAPMIGQTYSFRYRLEGDLWHNERFADGKLVERETWRRIK